MLVAAAGLALLIYFGVSIGNDLYAISRQQQKLEILNQQIASQSAKNDELSRVIENGSSEEQLERVARDKLGYVDPDERVYIDFAG